MRRDPDATASDVERCVVEEQKKSAPMRIGVFRQGDLRVAPYDMMDRKLWQKKTPDDALGAVLEVTRTGGTSTPPIKYETRALHSSPRVAGAGTMIANDSLTELYADLKKLNSAPLWTNIKDVNRPEPLPRAAACLWKYTEMRPLLERSGNLVSAADAERRVAMLLNPAIDRLPFTTDTIYAGLQLILPGEVARAHKHTAFAMRFIIEGDVAYTAVGGERVDMHVGDLVLTPPLQFHDHGNESDKPMIWLDGLDVPLYQWLPVHFTRFFKDEQYPAVDATDSDLVYPWVDMQAQLDAQPGTFATQEYRHRKTAEPISKTMGAQAERLSAKATSPERRETASSIYHVVSGSGSTRVEGQTIEWNVHDTFVVPAWARFSHTNSEDANTYLVRYDDVPLLRALDIYRTEEPA
jgi:gentisate 1,2-dioxygenase